MAREVVSAEPMYGAIQTRAERICQLRVQGWTEQQIADELNCELIYVRQQIAKRMNHEADLTSAEERQVLLQLERDRLDGLVKAHWLAATNGDPRSSDVVLKCIQTRIKLEKLDAEDISAGNSTVLVIGGQEKDYLATLMAAAKES